MNTIELPAFEPEKPSRILVLSDLHLGGRRPWSWCSEHGERQLVAMLHRRASDIRTAPDVLVLAGDIFDRSIWPIDQAPPTFAELASVHAEFVHELRDLHESCGTRVVALVGNHDEPDAVSRTREALPFAEVGDAATSRDGALHVEHGHAGALFNGPDPWMVGNLPLGWFLSRLSAGRPSPELPEARTGYLAELLKGAVSHESISEIVFDAARKRCGVPEDAAFEIGGSRGRVSCATVRERFRSLWARRVEAEGLLGAIRSLEGELGDLSAMADRLLQIRNAKMVVLGHTHEGGLWKRRRGIYANSGTATLGSERTYLECCWTGRRLDAIRRSVDNDSFTWNGAAVEVP